MDNYNRTWNLIKRTVEYATIKHSFHGIIRGHFTNNNALSKPTEEGAGVTHQRECRCNPPKRVQVYFRFSLRNVPKNCKQIELILHISLSCTTCILYIAYCNALMGFHFDS